MTDELKLNREVQDGAAAARELELTDASFEKLRTAYTEAWAKSSPADAAGRERLYLAVQVLDTVKQQLKTTVQTGEMAKRSLKDLERAGRPRRLGIMGH